jgi:ferredoxin
VFVEADEVSSGATDELVVDRDVCMGSGNCAYSAPGVFDLDEEGVAVVCGPRTGREEEVRRAILNCPTSAISFEQVARP